jgi:hypothetical protein
LVSWNILKAEGNNAHIKELIYRGGIQSPALMFTRGCTFIASQAEYISNPCLEDR